MPYKIIFAGTPEFALPALRALIDSEHSVCAVYTQPDRPAGRGRHLSMSPVKELALSENIPVFQPATLRDTSVQDELKKWQADLMVVVAYGQILPQVVLTTPKYGCINVHASLLPRWRGAAPIQRAIMAGDTQTGVTIMQMDVGLDTGAMLMRESCPILAEDTGQILHDRLAELGATALIKTLNAMEKGDLQSSIQDESHVTYAQKLNKLDGKIEWAQSASQIERQIRALNPWPIAYTECGKNHVRIWHAEIVPEKNTSTPGKILAISPEGIDVVTGDGILRLKIIQEAGGKPIAVSAFVNAPRDWILPGNLLS
ncbi:MAG: methionyl-tRNA formyltransferase [Gammaproteobacteria bacterium]|nr:methionyl-tRNA formyltransferase [Gammaproteobacteria bacterium]